MKTNELKSKVYLHKINTIFRNLQKKEQMLVKCFIKENQKKFISKVIPLKWRLKSSPESRKPTKEENRSVNHYQIKPDIAK